jgi:zinc transporter ZupT
MAVPAFVFVDIFTPFLPVGLGFAAGAMVWMVLVELTPDALANASPRATGLAGVLAFTAMTAFQEIVL